MKIHITLLICLLFCGCATMTGEDIESQHQKNQQKAQEKVQKLLEKDSFGEQNQVSVYNKNYVDLQIMDHQERLEKDADWVHRKISLNIQRPVEAKELMRMLRDKGINIASSLPLGSYMYSGMGVHDTPIDKALKVTLGSMGLDYNIDYENKTISVVPMQWKTYYVNLGERSTSFKSGSGEAGGGDDSEDDSEGNSDIDMAQNEVKGESSYSISSEDIFWDSLKKEIKNKLTILVPIQRLQSRDEMIYVPELMPDGGEMASEGKSRDERRRRDDNEDEDGLYEEIQVGRYSMNPSTGAVHIQAPSWLQKTMTDYFQRINRQYNTQIRFDGRLFLITEDSSKSRGVDLSLFEDIADDIGVGFANNALGGVTLELPDKSSPGKIEVSGDDSINTGLFGVYDKDNSLRAFSAYLDQTADITVVQKPTLTTTSGVPAKFQKFITRYYNSVSQTATSSEGGTAVGTENELVPVKLGTILTINPRYDVEKDMVRAQINLEQNLLSGFQTTNQYVTSDGSTQSISLDIPLVTQSAYSGEAVLEDGDLLIIGGQVDFQTDMTKSGSAFLKKTPLSVLLGKKELGDTVSTYYFALHVSVEHN